MTSIEVFCIASGPSLTKNDCELIRQSGVKIVAVNNSWEAAPFCDYLYAGDRKWWAAYIQDILPEVKAERWTCSAQASIAYNLKLHSAVGGYNTGMRAIQFCMMKGFKSIGLLGYDCSVKNGVHWHGPHQKEYALKNGVKQALGNPKEKNVEKWLVQFRKISRIIDEKNVKIYNCSRYTELDCFERMNLEDALRMGDLANVN